MYEHAHTRAQTCTSPPSLPLCCVCVCPYLSHAHAHAHAHTFKRIWVAAGRASLAAALGRLAEGWTAARGPLGCALAALVPPPPSPFGAA